MAEMKSKKILILMSERTKQLSGEPHCHVASVFLSRNGRGKTGKSNHTNKKMRKLCDDLHATTS